MEGCASDARGESKSTDAGSPGFTGAEFAVNSAVVDTGAAGTTGTAGASGVAEGKFSGAPGSKDVDNAEESSATGATGFWTMGSVTFGAGRITDFASATLGPPSLTTETESAGLAAGILGTMFTAGPSTLS